MSVDAELIEIFLEESRENLDQVDLDLIALEADPRDGELLARVFRAMHTIKGTCGFLGFDHLQALAHSGEDLLAALRSGARELDEPATTALLHLVDRIREVLDTVAATGTEPVDDNDALIAELASQLPGAQVPGPPAPRAPQTPELSRPAEPPPVSKPSPPVALDPSPAPAPTPSLAQPSSHPSAPSSGQAGGETNSVRVSVAILDRLSDLVGELTLARLQLGDLIDPDDGPAAATFHQLTLLTRALQDDVMLARLEPIGTVTSKMRRLARDLAAGLGRNVRVELSGQDVGVDRAINEILRDPLTHLVRNAIDHGIEDPADRLSLGKPAEALVRIDAAVAGGRVQIRVSDDGRGIDVDRLVAKAVGSGRITAQRAAAMGREEKLALVFLPGVSTATRVTEISGRGVGMDVVWSNLDRVGGSVEIESTPGAGTEFCINVPMTLAIIPALIVRCAGQRFALAQVDIESVAHVPASDLARSTHEVDGRLFLRRAEGLVPLICLAGPLGLGRPGKAMLADSGLDIVVVRRPDLRYGLVVEGISDNTEAVVKPLPEAIRGVPLYSGVTILADGSPALILDLGAVSDVAGIEHARTHAQAPDPHARAAGEPGGPAVSLLLAEAQDGRHVAFPAQQLRRIESVRAQDVQRLGDQEVLVRPGGLVPLQRVGGQPGPGATAGPAAATFQAAVFARGPRDSVAVALRTVLDVCEVPEAQIDRQGHDGLPPSVRVAGMVAELLDPELGHEHHLEAAAWSDSPSVGLT